MDKLQWFKFCPTDWVMGKIQRCPEITQARFLKLCCLYWNKDCQISVEDAIIEIDKDHFDILVAKKIIFISDEQIYISFLDEQNVEIKETSKDKSVSGIVGNLKRWHPELYKKFSNKEITLDYAIELSKSITNQSDTNSTPIADLSHTDSIPIAPQSQNIADKDKEKIKNREDNIIIINSAIFEKENSISEQTIRNQYDKFLTTDSVQKEQMAMSNNMTKRQIDIACIGFVTSLLESGELEIKSIYPKFGNHFRNWFNKYGKDNLGVVPKAKIEVEFKKFKIHEFKEKNTLLT